MKMFIMKHALIVCYFKTAVLSCQKAVIVMLPFVRSPYEVI